MILFISTLFNTLLLFIFLYKLLTSSHTPPSAQVNLIRVIKGVVILMVVTIWLMPLHLPLFLNGGVLLFSAWIGFGYCGRIELNELTLLSLTPSFKSNQYHVHLSTVIHPFTRDTYRELELLIELLPKYSGQSLVLTSPLLAKHGSFHNIEQLKQLPVSIEASYHSYWRSPLAFLRLCYYKYIQREIILMHSDLSRQCRIHLTLPRVDGV
ncbi:conserved membrane hypothetical protein [Vibrio crassostreae]|nr:conserved membrane hypothetical protein [Vibrio crassostreae]CAK1810623.1 conserved membrane hypothetical protein [Vibrio crassostreae]CAK1814779.1 conserved membrane hypothetical protein [Vibrio crassostreae]CAK1896412.1 conserved membrane hypothetical protein [Vibrio crassostreae]CAK3168147.1 conserved membrane hypothetical protein [Vibrio crassostreae]